MTSGNKFSFQYIEKSISFIKSSFKKSHLVNVYWNFILKHCYNSKEYFYKKKS